MDKVKGSPSKIPILSVLDGEQRLPPPIWFMRQAGRYLPEYCEIRAKAGGFIELCLKPDLATEVTLQPVRRFGLDAAILFSDILIVPYALGVNLWFEVGEGPRLDPITTIAGFDRIRDSLNHAIVDPVYEAVTRVRAILLEDAALIGFCGAPWTVATYLIAGRGTEDQAPAKLLMQQNPELFGRIIDRLVEATAEHLIGQLTAGADVVQIFDTWAGALDAQSFENWCIKPTAEIVSKVRAKIRNARIIVFPKGVQLSQARKLAEATEADAVSLDWTVDRKQARDLLADRFAIQGNLDPATLVKGGDSLNREIDDILAAFRGTRHIFNLGHGIRQETPIEHVEQMVARVRRSV